MIINIYSMSKRRVWLFIMVFLTFFWAGCIWLLMKFLDM